MVEWMSVVWKKKGEVCYPGFLSLIETSERKHTENFPNIRTSGNYQIPDSCFRI